MEVIDRRWRTSGISRDVFVDTSALVALAHPADNNNLRAKAILNGLLIPGRYRPHTTMFVLAETQALVLRRTRQPPFAASYVARLYRGELTIIRVAEADEAAALGILTRYQDKFFSFTDAISFAVMERLGIRRVFSYDSDFDQYGAQRGWARLA